MAVSVEWYVFPTAVAVGPVTGMDFISANNALNSEANRIANPIAIGDYSYEKWLRPFFTITGGSVVTNIRVFGVGAMLNPTTMMYGGYAYTWDTPIATASPYATTRWVEAVSGSPISLGDGPMASSGYAPHFLVLQLYGDYYELNKGHWGPEEIFLSWQESS